MDGTALPFTQQDCIVLDIALQIEIHRTVFKWAGMPGVEWTALHLTGLDCCSWLSWSWAVPDGNTLQSTCMDGTLLEWTAVSGTRLDQTRQHCPGLLQTVLDYTRVHYTALSWIELEITIQDSLYRIGLNLEGLFWIV